MPPLERTDAEIDELCRLLLGTDRARLLAALDRLEQRGLFVDWQSHTLADAMRLALARDPAFADAMGTLISKGVHTTVQRDAATFGKALAPAMGPAIRSAVLMMLQGFVQSIETIVDQRLSMKSMRWRWQALRSGRSFAEIAFVNTLLYRVEHVFLVHKEGGVQLLHASPPGVLAREPDLIASMLTAIQDFVRDAFQAPSGDTLRQFEVGELTVLVESGSFAALAAVVRGQDPPEVRQQLRESLDRIEQTMATSLAKFRGDVDEYEAVRPYVEACLLQSVRPEAARRRAGGGALRWVLLTAALALATWLGLRWFDGWQRDRAVARLAAVLRSEPGYLVTEVTPTANGWRIAGLRDPLARAPEPLAQQHSVGASVQLELQPWQSQHAPFVLQRAHTLLAPPTTVALALEHERLVVRGSASPTWLQRCRDLAPLLLGVTAIDTSACRDEGR
jgi:hypothetical protein